MVPSSNLIAITTLALAMLGAGACATKPPPPDPTPIPVAASAPQPDSPPATSNIMSQPCPTADSSADDWVSSGSAAPVSAGVQPTSTSVGATPAAHTSTPTQSSATVAAKSTCGSGAAARGAPASAPSGSATPTGTAQTSAERQAVLDRQLDDSLTAFDATLRKEQQKLAQQRDARPSILTSSSQASGSQADAEQASGKRSDSSKSAASHAGDLKSDRSASGLGAATAGNGFTPREVPDGNDDDIVARRLRKAAEQETDPELREKLWKEYADYKQNAQVN
jgi:hypothetical protein